MILLKLIQSVQNLKNTRAKPANLLASRFSCALIFKNYEYNVSELALVQGESYLSRGCRRDGGLAKYLDTEKRKEMKGVGSLKVIVFGKLMILGPFVYFVGSSRTAPQAH